jgi:hypothetical protein
MKREYKSSIFKIVSSTGDFYVGYCYLQKLDTHFKNIKKKYLLWKNNLNNTKYYCVLFGFFEKFGLDCEIILLKSIRSNVNKIKDIVKYIVDGLEPYENCYNNHNNIIKKYSCYYLKI